MNAKDAIDLLDQCGSCDILHGNEELVIRALRLLAAAEANDGSTPECDAAQVQVEVWVNGERREQCTTAINDNTALRLERERNGLAARVRELERGIEIATDRLTGPGGVLSAIDAERSK